MLVLQHLQHGQLYGGTWPNPRERGTPTIIGRKSRFHVDRFKDHVAETKTADPPEEIGIYFEGIHALFSGDVGFV